jgi:hypothetical protein
MKHTLAAAFVALAVIFCSQTAKAGDLPSSGMTLEELQTWLQGAGYSAQIETSSGGERNIHSAYDGVGFHIYQYDCKAGRCGSLQFAVGFNTKGAFSPVKMNDWNRDNRWARAYIDKTNDPWLEMDVDLTPGGTYELLNDEFATWRSAFSNFRKFINW